MQKKRYIYIGVVFLFLGFPVSGQVDSLKTEEQKGDEPVFYFDNDSLSQSGIVLDEVVLLERLQFASESDRRAYLLLRRRTRKVYPYAKLAAERLQTMNERLETIEKKRDRAIYTRRIQKYIENEFSDQLKNLTRSEGRTLVKLIYRQTGSTAFDLVKDLRTGWRAFWYNVTANVYEISLKEEYNPFEVKEDYLIEDILLRAFQENALEPQQPAMPINYLDLVSYWNKQNVDN